MNIYLICEHIKYEGDGIWVAMANTEDEALAVSNLNRGHIRMFDIKIHLLHENVIHDYPELLWTNT